MLRSPSDDAISWLKELIAFASVSSTSNEAITRHVRQIVESLGFHSELTSYTDQHGVAKFNLIARRDAAGDPTSPDDVRPGLAYFCHTDVVPVNDWTGPADAFTPTIDDNRLYGRGACDMKGSLAVMLASIARIAPETQSAPIWITATADEEVGFAGARHLVQHSDSYRTIVADQPIAIIGEPTMLTPYHAHKGITGFRLTSHGKAGHSSTRHGMNANIAMVPLLNKLLEIEQRTREDARYQDERFDPPNLSWNFGFSDHMTAINITPPTSHAWCSLRTMPDIDGEELIDEVRELADQRGVDFKRLEGSPPMWVDADSDFLDDLKKLTGKSPETVCYATDGGVMTDLKYRVVLGPGDIAQAHTSDEFISLDQIDRGIKLYTKLLRRWA